MITDEVDVFWLELILIFILELSNVHEAFLVVYVCRYGRQKGIGRYEETKADEVGRKMCKRCYHSYTRAFTSHGLILYLFSMLTTELD